MTTTPALVLEDVSMVYQAGGRRVLDGVDLSLAPGTSAALVGRSGSGKSTLLHLAAGIATPTSGRVVLAGRDLGTASEAERTERRRHEIGLVFQFFHLLPHLSVFENVVLPAWIAGTGRDLDDRATGLLERVGLADRRRDRVGRLSGGEMQRVALCRALLRAPALILADEPTGSLDEATGAEVMALLLEMVSESGAALLFATHSRDLAATADRAWRLQDGRLGGAAP